jgi:hypothetical protein
VCGCTSGCSAVMAFLTIFLLTGRIFCSGGNQERSIRRGATLRDFNSEASLADCGTRDPARRQPKTTCKDVPPGQDPSFSDWRLCVASRRGRSGMGGGKRTGCSETLLSFIGLGRRSDACRLRSLRHSIQLPLPFFGPCVRQVPFRGPQILMAQLTLDDPDVHAFP